MIVLDYNTLGKKSAKSPGVLNDTKKKKRKTKGNKEINNKDNKKPFFIVL